MGVALLRWPLLFGQVYVQHRGCVDRARKERQTQVATTERKPQTETRRLAQDLVAKLGSGPSTSAGILTLVGIGSGFAATRSLLDYDYYYD